MKTFIPNEKERRAIATLVDAMFKNGAVRSEETYEFLSSLKRKALAGLPPIPKPPTIPDRKIEG